MFRRPRPLGLAIFVALLALAGAAPSQAADPQATTTFPYVDSDAPQLFTVPSGVMSINVSVTGAQGGSVNGTGIGGGLGAAVTGTLSVTPGEVLCIFVGGSSGRNGGGSRGTAGSGGNGGGASDIRRGACGLQDRIVVAGGGGGVGGQAGSGVPVLADMYGGNAGESGKGYASGAGTAGTLSSGGTGGQTYESGGTSGGNGASGQGGAGGNGPSGGGGGGGGGYFGGGGGAGAGQRYLTVNTGPGGTITVPNSGPAGSGGGGGSSLVPAGGSSTLATAGGNGSVSISFTDTGSPSATISTPTGNPVVRRNFSALLADYACADAEGVKSCVGSVDGSPVADGAALPTSTEGEFTLSVTATDLLDRTATATATYRVDGTAPTTSDDVPTAPQSGPTEIHLSAIDGPASGAAGVDRIYYTVGANPATPTTSSSVYNPASPPVLRNGQRIRYFAVDKVGNTELPKTSAPLKAPPGFTVSLVTVPSGSARFDVQLDGAGRSETLGNSEAFGTTVAYNANLTLRVAAASGTEAAAYDLAIDCGSAGSSTGSSLALSNLTTDTSCTVTATYRPKVTVTTSIKPGDVGMHLSVAVNDTPILTAVGDGQTASTRISRGAAATIELTPDLPSPRNEGITLNCSLSPGNVSASGGAVHGSPFTRTFGDRQGDTTCTATLTRPPMLTFTNRELPSGDARATLQLFPGQIVDGSDTSDAASGSRAQGYGYTGTLTVTGPAQYTLAVDCGAAGSSSTDDPVAGLRIKIGPLTHDGHCDVTLKRWPTFSVWVAVLPASDPLRADVSVDGKPVITGGGDGATSSRSIVAPGTRVSAMASLASGVNASDYERAVDCGAGATAGSEAAVTVVESTQCTFTFTRKPPPAPAPTPQAETGFTLATSAPRAVVAVSAATSLRTRCTVSRRALRRCRVVATDAAGNRVGAGELNTSGQRRSGVVNVVLDRAALQRAGLRSRVLKVTLSAEATASGSRTVARATRSTLVVPAVVRVGFTAGTSTLTPDSREAIERIAATLERAKAVECSGYVSTLLPEPTPFGLTLAGQRASAVCNALRGAGLKARFAIRNRGADRTIEANDTPQGRALNRRVELRITL